MPTDAEMVAAVHDVASALPGGGEERAGQTEMAAAVARAIRVKRHLVVQAGTGTGKSLAYLVPSILSGRKLVVATATKALQDQLAERDLPLLRARLETPFTFAVLKGRANYLCRQRVAEIEATPEELDLEDEAGDDTPRPVGMVGAQVRRLVDWSRQTRTGDRAELDFEPAPRAWRAVSVTAAECPGAGRCPRGGDCLAEAARHRAGAADVVVVNTHLYAAHLASGGAVLPDHELVVFDEAHELEDVLAAGLGLEVGPGRLRALARAARVLLGSAATADAVADAADRLEAALRDAGDGRLTYPLPEELGAALELAESRVDAMVAAAREAGGGKGEAAPGLARVLQAAGHLVEEIRLGRRADERRVAWAETGPRSSVLKLALVEVGPLLAESVWSRVTGVLTSATIPPGIASRVGLPPEGHSTLDVGSSFPYERNSLLYCAVHLPDPRNPAYEEAVHQELEALIGAAGGRALALFTSWRAMHAAADALRDRVPGRLLTQADLPKPALVAAFTREEDSSLFATMGFFQGVDVPGRTLSLVTLDRIPFPRPDDPLTQARRDRAGEAAFRDVDLPRAATLLAQGAGRLIRSSTDRGVVAVLDPRLGRASYRWTLVNALPPMRRTRHRREAEEFLRQITGSPVTGSPVTGSPDARGPGAGAASPGPP